MIVVWVLVVGVSDLLATGQQPVEDRIVPY